MTTLRRDVETDGRHAVVHFTTDWEEDASRRDFTMNALYCDVSGEVLDPLGGLADLRAGRVRFIGDAEDRIREDYLAHPALLPLLRAWYGTGRPDPDGLKACARLKSGIATLSAERVWAELKRLLKAPDPARALLWMRTTEVLQKALPESWGIDAIHRLIAAERAEGWQPDPLLRLEAILPPHRARIEALSERLRLSKAEAARLHGWADAPEAEPAALGRATWQSSSTGRSAPACSTACGTRSPASGEAGHRRDGRRTLRQLIAFAETLAEARVSGLRARILSTPGWSPGRRSAAPARRSSSAGSRAGSALSRERCLPD